MSLGVRATGAGGTDVIGGVRVIVTPREERLRCTSSRVRGRDPGVSAGVVVRATGAGGVGSARARVGEEGRLGLNLGTASSSSGGPVRVGVRRGEASGWTSFCTRDSC